VVAFPVVTHFALRFKDVLGCFVFEQTVTHDCEDGVGVFLQTGALEQGLVVVDRPVHSCSAPLEDASRLHGVAVLGLLEIHDVEHVVHS